MADALEVRIAHLEGAYEQIDKRLAGVETGLSDLRQEISQLRQEIRQEIGQLRQDVRQDVGQLRQEMNELRRQVGEQFRWIVGIQILAWISILGTLLVLLFRR